MSENLIIYEAEPALLTPKGRNYTLNIGNTKTILKRDIDFGTIPGTQRPSLYKSGAEAIAMGYGLLQHYDMVSSVENWDGDAVLHKYSMGNKLNMWETMGFPWDYDDVSAHTTEELIRLLIKYKYHPEELK